jgi:hypothetical protein
LKNNLPRVPVYDLKIHPRENDLIIATHGRSIWLLDDITPLEQLSDAVMSSDAHLFDSRPGVEWHMMDAKSAIGHAFYVADNPTYGGIIDYYLKNQPEAGASVRLEILDGDGKVVRRLTDVPSKAGVNRTSWDLRTDSAAPAGQGGGGGRRGGGRGILVAPGVYTARLSLGASQMTTKIEVEDDARVTLTPEGRAARTEALTELFNLSKQASAAQGQFTGLRASIETLRASWKQQGTSVPPAARAALDDLEKKMNVIEKPVSPDFAAGTPLAKYSPGPVSDRISQLMSAIDGYAYRPTSDQLKELEELKTELPPVNAKIKELIDVDLPATNKEINAAGVPALSVEQSGVRNQRGRNPPDN